MLGCVHPFGIGLSPYLFDYSTIDLSCDDDIQELTSLIYTTSHGQIHFVVKH